MKFKTWFNIILVSFIFFTCDAQDKQLLTSNVKIVSNKKDKKIKVGAEQTDLYINFLKDKKVGVVANHTSMVGSKHLVDYLISLNINIIKVFSPEHGFRGKADAGEKVQSNVDEETGLPIISLYGNNKKPTTEQIKDLDVILFDIQDVGARFYTYISTMHYVMEACAENGVKFIVLDRPNPNGHYVDGPILEKELTSFIGMHPVPIVHGMTIGEYAMMVNGEGWLNNNITCDLEVIRVDNYHHKFFYNLPIKPSPNLPNMSSVYLYPSLCLFEGTPISIGRGTDMPFQVVGHPDLKAEFSFIPKSNEGAKNPKLKGEKCYGYNLSTYGELYMKGAAQLNLFWLIDVYKRYKNKNDFFKSSFNKLAGTTKLKQQLINNVSEKEIRKSWQIGLKKFKQLRKKYLLYPDFE